jgi:hypothetical protein
LSASCAVGLGLSLRRSVPTGIEVLTSTVLGSIAKIEGD